MSHVCRDDMSGFDRLLRLPPDAPERVEVEACPRCGARFLEFRAFLRGDDVPGANPVEAEERLSSLVDAHAPELLGQPRRDGDGWWARVRRGLSTPRVVVPALALMAIIVVGVWRWQPWVDRSLEVRSTAVERGSITLISVEEGDDGGVSVTWAPVPSADSYAVRLLGARFTEIRRIGPVTTTDIRIEPADLPSDKPLYWQVVALQGGDEIASSPIRELPDRAR